MNPVQIISCSSDSVNFSNCLDSITSLSINTMETNIFLSWETSLPFIKLFEISFSINGDTNYLTTTNQATLQLTDLSPNTNVRIGIQPITACGPVGSAIILNTSTDVPSIRKTENVHAILIMAPIEIK